ncbi:MAG: hypothetical protein DI582_07210 [Azospirillum brasilense]|nr:MAG: hypothetical protein DI582_07210 [Azospirillum brasilense]
MQQAMTYQPLPGSQPLHEILWTLGKSWLSSPQRVQEEQQRAVQPLAFDDAAYRANVERTTVNQLVMSMRMQGIAGEEDTMLSSLAEMATQGEIAFSDFIGRVQNLFPRTLDALDVTLRMKIASLVLPQN